jgi:hypothetical protein
VDADVLAITAQFTTAANAIDAHYRPTTITLGSMTIPVESAGIDAHQAKAAHDAIVTGWGQVDPVLRTILTSNISKVKIGSGTPFVKVGDKYELTFAAGVTAVNAKTNFENVEKDIGKCVCLPGTIILTSEPDCAKYCATVKVVGARTSVPGKATDGMAITNGDGISTADFNETVNRVNTALVHEVLSTETRQNFIKNNIQEIRIVPRVDGSAPLPPSGGIFTIQTDGPSALNIRNALNNWLNSFEPPIVMLEKDDAIRWRRILSC